MPAVLCYQGHVLMENRSDLVVGAVVSHPDFGERVQALRLLDCVPGTHRKTVGAGKAYDTRDFIATNAVSHPVWQPIRHEGLEARLTGGLRAMPVMDAAPPGPNRGTLWFG